MEIDSIVQQGALGRSIFMLVKEKNCPAYDAQITSEFLTHSESRAAEG